MKITPIACILSTLTLAACTTTTTTAEGLSYDEMGAAGHSIYQKLEHQQPDATTNPPENPTASYSGYAGFDLSKNEGLQPADYLLAKMDLTADFGASSIEGELSNFRTEENIAANGTLTLEDGEIEEDGHGRYIFTAGLLGTITMATMNLHVSGGVDGEFFGLEAQFIEGDAQGSFSDDAHNKYTFTGQIIAEKN